MPFRNSDHIGRGGLSPSGPCSLEQFSIAVSGFPWSYLGSLRPSLPEGFSSKLPLQLEVGEPDLEMQMGTTWGGHLLSQHHAPCSRDLVDEAKDYHLMPERRPHLPPFRTRPRCCTSIAGLIYAVGGLNSAGILQLPLRRAALDYG